MFFSSILHLYLHYFHLIFIVVIGVLLVTFLVDITQITHELVTNESVLVFLRMLKTDRHDSSHEWLTNTV